jgi:cellulose synthase/poly-beta-1,6-N-acetylglucosamine synthase-like glycosyltransferase
MSLTSLRPIIRLDASPLAGPVALHRLHPAPSESEVFGVALLRAGRISAPTLLGALKNHQIHLVDHLIASGVMDEAAAYGALAAHWAVGLADFTRHPVDSALIARVDAAACLVDNWVPWRRIGASTVIVCAYPEDFAALRPMLSQIFGTVVLAIAPRRMIKAQVMARAGAALARRAETLLPDGDSCRSFSPRRIYAPLGAMAAIIGAGVLAAPLTAAFALLCFALALAYGQTLLKLFALLASLRHPPAPPTQPQPQPARPALHIVPTDADLPFISILVPLFRESRIVARLIRRLERLDYPSTALEVIFLTEDNDTATASALSSITLPAWMRVLSVPTGTIRTKPRALNYGLDHCKGQIIGVYDAEDAPDLGQLRAVAQGFVRGGPRLACLQGRLDYYNPTHNWLSRCFTIEYAAWWRVILPGFARMGFAIPLGGTTLFFRSQILRELGGWDAHNVTEDADLGLRLVRRGYQTQLFDSTTYEEANSRAIPWIKQRSRWIKGYVMTYASHMRRPAALLRDLGAWRFFGMQMMFAGTVLHAILAPILALLWLAAFGAVSFSGFAGAQGLLQIATVGFAAEALMLAANYLGLRRAGHRLSPLWLPTMMAYNLLASLAAYKAVYEVLTKPFYWDKTAHGLFDD